MFEGVKDFLSRFPSSKPPLSSPSKSYESLKVPPRAQMSAAAHGALRGPLSTPEPIAVEDDVEDDDDGEYDAAPTSTKLMATRRGKTTSQRIPSQPERYASNNPLDSSTHNPERALMEVREPSESERPMAGVSQEEIARVLGGTTRQNKGATAIVDPMNPTLRPKQSSYGGFSGGRNTLGYESPLGVSLGKIAPKPSLKPLSTRPSKGSNVPRSKSSRDTHTEGPPMKKQRITEAKEPYVQTIEDSPPPSIATAKRANIVAQKYPTTSHNRQPSRGRNLKPPQVSEYWDTEGVVDPSLRPRGGADRSTQAAEYRSEPTIHLSSSSETLYPASTVGAVRKNREQSQAANRISSPFSSNPDHSTDGDNRKHSAHARPNMNEGDDNLRNKFKSTDGRRRDSTTQQDSEDELLGPATISTLIREPPNSNSNDDVEMLDSPTPVAEVAPSNIKRTNFTTSPKKIIPSEPPSKKAKRASAHEYAIEYLRIEECQVDPSDEGVIAVKIPEKILNVSTPKGMLEGHLLDLPIDFIRGIDRGTDGSRKLRLKVRKGAQSRILRIEFQSLKKVTDFIKSLQSVIPDVKMNDRPREWMDKVFEMDEAFKNTQPATNGPVPTHLTKNGHDRRSANEGKPRARLIDRLGVEGSRASDRTRRATSNQTVITGRDRAGLNDSIQDSSDVSELLAKSGLPASSARMTRSTRKTEDLINPMIPVPHQPTIEIGPRWKTSLVFPKGSKKSIHVEFSDMERLREHEFLNDNLIEFHIRYLQHYLEQDQPEIASKIYFFNTFFYERLTKDKKGGTVNFDAVAKWTSKVDIFRYDYVVVPINENTHWYLAIICNLRGLERKIASPAFDESDSEDEAAEKKGDTEKSEPRSTEPCGIDERLPLNLGADAEESNEEARESFASLHLGEPGGYSLAKGAQSDGEDKEWPSEGENVESHSKEMSKLARAGTPAKETAAKSSPIKSSKTSSTGKKGRKGKRKSLGPKYDPDIPAIITLDSLISQRGATIKALKEYLREEAKAKRQMKVEDKDLQGINAKGIPTQQNFSDCGLFLLAYLEIFLKDPKEFVAKIMKREMNEMGWPPTTGYHLRERLRKMIQRLHDEQQDKKIPNKEEDKFKRDTCEEGFTLLGPKKEASPDLTDVDLVGLPPMPSDRPSYEPTLAKSGFATKLKDRFHSNKRDSLDPISLEADGQSPKMANTTKIQVRNSQDEVSKSAGAQGTLSEQLVGAAKTVDYSGDGVEGLRPNSRSSHRSSVDTEYVLDPDRSYKLALRSEDEEVRNKEVVELDMSPGKTAVHVQA